MRQWAWVGVWVFTVSARTLWAQSLPATTPDALESPAPTSETTVDGPPVLPLVVEPHVAQPVPAPLTTVAPDLTWLNGGNRQTQNRLTLPYVTLSALLDVYYAYALHRPIDDTLIGSTTTGRHNELNLLLATLGGEFVAGNAHATLNLQLGSTATLVPRNDTSVNRGQYQLADAYRYIREAYAGYHWDALSGINLDAGLFMSYIGLYSYLNFENWGYQASYVSSNTPFFFQGLRLQLQLTPSTKLELWVVNGWQAYATFNDQPAYGFQLLVRPNSSFSVVTNGYAGFDTPNKAGRLRLHSDSSVLWRYYQNPQAKGVSRAAFSVTFDLGGENGDGVSLSGRLGAPAQYFIGAMAYHRLWFMQHTFGLTVGGGFIVNPGRYLVLLPPGPAAASFDTAPGTRFVAWDVSVTGDYMPSELVTFRLEGVYRHASVPYFAGHGGVTSPTGLLGDATAGFQPDYAPDEARVIAAIMFRI
jgi:hypothetical protein